MERKNFAIRSFILGLLAETSIHSGTGRSAGVIDLPVARETATDYPFIPGSGLKGSLRDRATQLNMNEIEEVFGNAGVGGTLLVSDARILLLPVRSLTGTYQWVTCPLVLERYWRDRKRCGFDVGDFELPRVEDGHCLWSARGSNGTSTANTLILEERELTIEGPCPQIISDAIKPLIKHEKTAERLARQLTVVDDNTFAYFCRFALPVQARNVLDDETKTSKNLWYEESLAPDTLMYAIILARGDKAHNFVRRLFLDSNPYLQVGGNETVGHGWMAVKVYEAETKDERNERTSTES